MPSDGGDEFLGGEVLLVAPVGHAGAIDDRAGILDIGNLLLGEGIPQDVFRQGLLAVPIVPGDLISGMHAETAVMPGHEFFDNCVAYFALSLEHGQDLGAEDLFQSLKVGFGEAMEGPVRSKEPIGDNSVKMRMKPRVISEGVDHHDHAQDAVIEAQHRAEEYLQALVGAVAKLCQELFSASQVFLDDFIHHRPKEPVLLLRMLVIAGIERFIVVVQDLPQGGIGGPSWMVDRCMGRHWKSITRLDSLIIPPAPERCRAQPSSGLS
jgi:hypothetical protein